MQEKYLTARIKYFYQNSVYEKRNLDIHLDIFWNN
jgi:hypothetical protein